MSERKDPIEARMAEVFFGFRGQGHSGVLFATEEMRFSPPK